MTALQMGVPLALLVVAQNLAVGLQTDPDITKYLEDIYAQFPPGALDPVGKEIRPFVTEVALILALSIVHGVIRISILLLERVLSTRYRLPETLGAGLAFTVSDYELDVQDEDDTGALGRAYKMQHDLPRPPVACRLPELPELPEPRAKDATPSGSTPDVTRPRGWTK